MLARYKINEDINSLGLLEEKDGDRIVTWTREQKGPCFVDILESDKPWVKLKIYLTNGDVLIGWQHNFFLSIHHIGNVWDGRYNA
jgi:hypothetical protein